MTTQADPIFDRLWPAIVERTKLRGDERAVENIRQTYRETFELGRQTGAAQTRGAFETDLRSHFALRAPKVPDWFEVPGQQPEPRLPSGSMPRTDPTYRAWNRMRSLERLAQWPWFYADSVIARRDQYETPAAEKPGTRRTVSQEASQPTPLEIVAQAFQPEVLAPAAVTGPDGKSLVADVECKQCSWEGPAWSIEKDGELGPCPKCGGREGLRAKGA